jgi:hypothetical protein
MALHSALLRASIVRPRRPSESAMDLKCSWYAAPASAARSAPSASNVFVADGIVVVEQAAALSPTLRHSETWLLQAGPM